MNARSYSSGTPVHDAMKQGHKEIVELLITEGADVNIDGQDGNRLLHHAIAKGSKEMVEFLISKRCGFKRKGQKWIYTIAYGSS